MIEEAVAIFAVVVSARQLSSIIKAIKEGGIIIPPLFASSLIFLLSLVIVLLSNISKFHLIWLFILSFPAGIVIIISPHGQKFIFNLFSVLHVIVNKKIV